MGRFETVNVLMEDGEVHTISRSTSTENRPFVSTFNDSSLPEPQFDGATCWYPEGSETVLHIKMSDTTNMGIVGVVGSEEKWSVVYRGGSLWTFTVDPGPYYNYHEDVMKKFPWAEIGGTLK